MVNSSDRYSGPVPLTTEKHKKERASLTPVLPLQAMQQCLPFVLYEECAFIFSKGTFLYSPSISNSFFGSLTCSDRNAGVIQSCFSSSSKALGIQRHFLRQTRGESTAHSREGTQDSRSGTQDSGTQILRTPELRNSGLRDEGTQDSRTQKLGTQRRRNSGLKISTSALKN